MSDYHRRDRRSHDSGSSSHRHRPRHHDEGRDRHDSKGRHSCHHDGDWVCSGCGNNNFARRKQCNKCGQDKVYVKAKAGGVEIGKQLAEKSKGLFAADDWQCKMCGNVNWSRRNECNVCKSPKVGCIESRTGYGGGFNERGNVEYNDKQDSDGEYDEFGRKKKQYRGHLPEEPRGKMEERRKESSDDDDEEEEEEEDEKSDAYNLSPDEEEEDVDDDDDDNDVSAYDLGNSDDDDDDDATNTEKKETKINPTSRPNGDFAKSSNAEKQESTGHGDQQKKRPRSRSRSNERETKKFAES